MSSASAVSRSLKPVKYRSSTTRLARRSICSRRESASSSATRSSLRSPAAGSMSLSEITDVSIGALLRIPGARVVHENVAHVACDGGKEVGAALPVHVLGPEQPHVHLVNERRGTQRVIRTLLLQVVCRDAPQLRIDERDQLVARGLVALTKLTEKRRNVSGTSPGHGPAVPSRGQPVYPAVPGGSACS